MALDGPEEGERAHELPEVDLAVRVVHEEGVDDAVTQWIDCQLGDSQQVFPTSIKGECEF